MANKGSFKTGDPRAGRRAGSLNKTTRAVKEAYALAFEKLGGVKALVAWGKENQTEFYKLHARLIPTEQHIANPDGTPMNFMLLVSEG